VERFFTPEERWWGGHYELVVELGPRSDDRMVAALQALWTHPALTGPYADRTREPTEQAPVDPATGIDGHLLGVATLPDGLRAPCGSWAHRRESPPADGPYQDDCLGFYLPVAGLAAVWPQIGSFPFPEPADEDDPEFPFPDKWRRVDDQPWQEPLEAWFAEIGTSIFERAPYRVGLIGFEIYLSDDDWARWRSEGIPLEHPLAFLWPSDGNLQWHPSTIWGRYEPGWGGEHPPVNDAAP
jgi:hypothetical protein